MRAIIFHLVSEDAMTVTVADDKTRSLPFAPTDRLKYGRNKNKKTFKIDLIFILNIKANKVKNTYLLSFILSNVSEIIGVMSYLWCSVLPQVVPHRAFLFQRKINEIFHERQQKRAYINVNKNELLKFKKVHFHARPSTSAALIILPFPHDTLNDNVKSPTLLKFVTQFV